MEAFNKKKNVLLIINFARHMKEVMFALCFEKKATTDNCVRARSILS